MVTRSPRDHSRRRARRLRRRVCANAIAGSVASGPARAAAARAVESLVHERRHAGGDMDDGPTGEVQGERPYSWAKISFVVISVLIVVLILLAVMQR